MPQHVFRNSTQSPSSDSNNSLSASAAAAAAAAFQQMHQKSQLSESHSQPAETALNVSDSDRSHHQLNALTAEKDNDFDKNVSVSTLTGVDQSNPTYLSSDDSSSMPSPIQSKNGLPDFGSRSDGGVGVGVGDGANSNDNDDDEHDDNANDNDNNEVQSSTRSSATMHIPRHESETPSKTESAADSRKEIDRKTEKPLKIPDYCQICRKRFDSFAALEAHMRSHKQFHCTICDKSFSTKGNLKVFNAQQPQTCHYFSRSFFSHFVRSQLSFRFTWQRISGRYLMEIQLITIKYRSICPIILRN